MTAPQVPPSDHMLDELEAMCAISGSHTAKAAGQAIAALRRERVPREPTDSMLWAGKRSTSGDVSKEVCARIWHNMYDAALSASKGEV